MVKTTPIWCILLLIGLSSASFSPELQQYATADWPTIGSVGCRFSKVLCSYDEECIDDGLFGNCQKVDDPVPDFYQHRLTKTQRRQLETVLARLISFGYAWSDSYTQCIISGILLTYRSGINYDINRCDAGPSDVSRRRPDLDGYDNEYVDEMEGTEYQTPDYVIEEPAGGVERGREWNVDDGTEAVGVGRRGGDSDGPGMAEFEEFLNGLDDRDIAALEKYVADDLATGEQLEKKASDTDFEDAYELQSPDESNPTEDVYYKGEESLVDKKDDMMDMAPNYQQVITRVSVNYDPGSDSQAPDADDANKDNNDDNKSSEPADKQQEQQAQQPPSQQQIVAPTADKPREEIADKFKATSGSQQQSKPARPSTANDVPAAAARQSSVGDYNSRGYTPEVQSKPIGGRMGQKYVLTMYVLCGLVGAVTLGAIVIYVARRRTRLHEKLANWVTTGSQQPSEEYQDLCRQHMQAKFSEKVEPVHPASRAEVIAAVEEKAGRTGSTGSSTSSWTEEPVTSNLDISTGHIVLAYMEDHFKNKDRLQQEWETLSAYDPEPCSIVAAIEPTNMRKNRYTDILPYEHSRVKLNASSNVSNSDYINASSIMDHDPRNPAYVATQGPLPHTVADFWQMIWEQGSIVIVNLTRLTENGVTVCHRYWPEEGSDLYHIYEVHLVSEHVWCEDYVIRSFYLKNLQTSETRTVTQFHFVAWPNNEVPSSAKSLLDFRRKVNKSFRCRSSPVVVHCSDGAGRTGTYCLIDMVLNRLSKGAKEIDIAATLEHIRDQRVNMVRTKEQFEFALTAVAQEVQAILHAPP